MRKSDMIIEGLKNRGNSPRPVSKKLSRVKANNGLGDYDFEFSLYKGDLRIYSTWNYFDKKDYAFFDPKTGEFRSYSNAATDFVVRSLDNAGISTKELIKIYSDLT